MSWPAGARTRRSRAAAATLLVLAAVLPGPVLGATPAGAHGASGAGGVSVAPGTSQRGHVLDLGTGPVDATKPSGRAYLDGVVLVGYRHGAKAGVRAAAGESVRATAHRALSPRARDVERLSLAPGESVDAAIAALTRNPEVRFAEPDFIITTDHTAPDPLYQGDYLWNLEGSDSTPSSSFGSGAAEAWGDNEIGSRDVFVGIVDTGVDINHPDLAANIWTNPYETPGNGIDDDGNGYVDDVHGWDFFHDDATVFDSATSDYHGTHVAGTIGAAGANGEGAVGVNWAVTMIPAKFIDGEGTISGAVGALDYITDLKTRHGMNIVATNDSWGDSSFSQALEDAINRGGDAGILFVAAAGNDGHNIDSTASYPAADQCDTRFDNSMARGFDCLLSVAAITEAGGLASFSNYGATNVDIAAPGELIASTYPGKQYAYLSGTSMAAPHVTGAIALLASCQSAPTANGLRQSVLNHGVATASLAGHTATGDRLEIGDMMADCSTGGPPRALLTAPAVATDAPAQVLAWFSEPVTGLDPADFTIGGTSTGWSAGTLNTNGSTAAYVMTFTAAAPTAGHLDITLPAGSLMGVSLAGPAEPATISLLVDQSAPTVTIPTASIRSGVSLSAGAIPVRVSWAAADLGGVRYTEVWYMLNGAGWNLLDSFVGSTVDVLVNPTGTVRLEVRTFDWAGHSSAYEIGPALAPRVVQEAGSGVTYAGSWAKGSSSSFAGGGVKYTGVGGRSATFTVTARSIGFVTTLAAARGVVKIYIDGVLAVRVDLRKPLAYQRLVWSKTFAAAKSHKVKVLVLGGYGRVDIDGFAYLR